MGSKPKAKSSRRLTERLTSGRLTGGFLLGALITAAEDGTAETWGVAAMAKGEKQMIKKLTPKMV